MSLIRTFATVCLIVSGYSLFGQAPNLQLNLRYNVTLSRYEVYALPDATQASFNWGPSQVSVVTPASVPDMALNVTSVAGGAWLDNSQVYAPGAAPGSDFHGIGSLGAPTSFVLNTEKLIFHFTLPGGGCIDGLRLYINGSDPTSSGVGMGGGDFTNTIFAIVPGVPGGYEAYVGNYNNTGTACNNPPVITSDGGGATASINVPENTTAVTTVTATDPDIAVQTLTYTITGGADAALFTINATTGALSFITAPSFETPTDAGANNVYDVQVTVTDNGTPNLSDVQDIAVTITDANENPMITSNGGGATASVSVPENTTAVTTVTAMDPDSPAQTLTYTITGGADAALFTINATTGVLSFITAPNFEVPTDAGANNVYDVQVTVTDNGTGLLTDVQAIAVTVTDVNEAPVITSNGGGATASVSIPENTTAVTTVTATDEDTPAQTLTYTITGGADAALFTINATTGALSFITAPSFETPTDAGANNVYDVQVTVTDNGTPNLSDVQDIAVTITDANENPMITSNGGGVTASVSVPENTTAVTTVTTVDPDSPAQTLTYTITGGADAALFTINATTGVLSFITAPNFEVPTDAGANNVYDVQVTVTDNGTGLLTDVQAIAVTVTDVNEAPVITSNGGGATASVSIPENTTAVTTVTATDEDTPAQTLTYTITGGADAALFTINATTGALSFITAPSFETPTDAGANNVYDVQVTVTDNGTPNLSDVQDIAVTITDANENPMITSNGGGATASVSVPENTTAVTTVTAMDPDSPAQTLTYTITGGADAALFTINATTGVLSFITAPNFEVPTDAGANNVYDVQVTVTDGTLTDVQAIAVTVTDVNEAPVITSNGGGATASVSIPENTTAVTTVTATDEDTPAQTLTYTITGGADAALFTINATTGALSFITAPSFETPTDAGANNVYDVQVTVTDNGTPNLSDVQDIAVTITDGNENPMITSNGGGATASVSVPENTTAVTTVTAMDPDSPAQTLTYTITGGADAALFTINATTGVLSFITAPNFEVPTDAGANNVYDVQVTVTDNGTGSLTDVQAIAVTVTDVNEAPVITSNGGGATASVSIPENTTAVTTVTATDEDTPAQTLTYTITGGADAALFTINATTGALSFITAPSFETPTDAGANNVYDVQVTVTDNGTPNLSDVQDIAVTITDGNENPMITSNGGGATASVSIPENTTAVTTVTAMDPDSPAQTLTYTITGGADAALFTINATTGVLSFITAPNFEVPTDAGANNVYDVQVTVTDGTLTDVQAIAVTVTDVNEAPVITSNGGGATASVSIPENTTAVTTVTATDEDTPAQTLTYTITGGADAALFTINATTGALSFITAPSFETPTDAGANNVYDVQVTVTDNGTPNLSDVQDIAVTITDGNENPMITSNGGGATASVSVPENTTAVTTVTAMDPDSPAQTLTYTITGGADAALFTINATTGVLSFITAPNFEVPTDAGANNVYDVQVTVTDNGTGLLTDVQAIAVTVTDVNEAPVITSNGGGATASVSIPENTTAVTTVTATDEDTPAQTLTYTITGGADAALFTINATTGALSFITAPSFETPTDAGANNVYDVQVTVTDNGTPNLSDVQDIAVTITDGNENPMITSNGGGATASVSVPENTTAVTTVTAMDPDSPAQTLTYTITGGADAALFTINATTGVLSFITAPNFEVPTDAGANNVYDVQVTVTDGTLTDVQAIAVTVTDVNEAPVITSNGGGATASVSIPENTTAVTTVTATDEDTPAQTLTYTITGGADAALFTINATTGALSFITAPSFETPTDAGANNVYDVQVTVTDNGTPNLSDVQDIAVTITDGNENPMITSNGGGATASVSVPENTTAVTTVTAVDPDSPAQTLTYTITGGADAALFMINATTGVLSFITAPNFEVPTDAGANNVYDVQVTVTDNGTGLLTDVQAIAVTVTDVNEAPVITSNGGGATASVSIPENTTAVTTVTATDEDTPAQTLTYTITGGADAALFTINATTGALSFITAPNFEIPTDAGANNVYDVQVTVTDNGTGLLTDVQAIAVTVTDVNENGVLSVKAMLQGALLGTSNALMRDDLRVGGYIPLTEPYTAMANARFAHTGGGGGETTTSGVLAANSGTGNAIVDWVFVELRDPVTPTTVVATRSALIQRDGDVVSAADGTSLLSFTGFAGQQYYVTIKHRNHLSVMTATPVTLTPGGTVVDFINATNAQVYNKPVGANMVDYEGSEMVTVQGMRALWAGNTSADAKVKYQGTSSDNTPILVQVLGFGGNISGSYNYNNAFGYFSGDVNMDGKVKYQGATNDASFIFANVVGLFTLNTSGLYNYDLFIEQLPE